MKPIREVTAYAPATVANLGAGFDVLGLALDSAGDRVTARIRSGLGVTIRFIEGDGGKLPRDPRQNTAGIAALATLLRARSDVGIELDIVKGLPLGSGLGSSAASAAAAAHAVNILIGSPLRKADLVDPCLEAEAFVSGRHADNVAAAIMGGLVLVRSLDPLDLVRLPVPDGLAVAVATPALELATRGSREVLPESVSLPLAVRHAGNLAGFISACHSGDLALLARTLRDELATPARLGLIAGGREVMERAMDEGAIGSGISGAGPSMFALCRSVPSAAMVASAMAEAFASAGLSAKTLVSPADCAGVRRV